LSETSFFETKAARVAYRVGFASRLVVTSGTFGAEKPRLPLSEEEQ